MSDSLRDKIFEGLAKLTDRDKILRAIRPRNGAVIEGAWGGRLRIVISISAT